MFNLPKGIKYHNAEKDYLVFTASTLDDVISFVWQFGNAEITRLLGDSWQIFHSHPIGTVRFEDFWNCYFIHIHGNEVFKSSEKEIV